MNQILPTKNFSITTIAAVNGDVYTLADSSFIPDEATGMSLVIWDVSQPGPLAATSDPEIVGIKTKNAQNGLTFDRALEGTAQRDIAVGDHVAWAITLGYLQSSSGGISVLEGTDAPDDANGKDGDVYIEKDNDNHTLELYIKAAGSWGFIASLPQDGNLQSVIRGIDGQLADLSTKDGELETAINNLITQINHIPDTQTFNEMIADPSVDARVYDATNLAEATAERTTLNGDYLYVLREISNLNLKRNVDIDSIRIYAVGSDLSTTELHRQDWTILQDKRIIDFNISDGEKSGAEGKIQRADGRDFYHIRIAFYVGNAEADSRTATLWIVGVDRLREIVETPTSIKDKLETLAGNKRLNASAIDGLPAGSRPETTATILAKGIVNAYNGVYGTLTAGQHSPLAGYTYTGYSHTTAVLAAVGLIDGKMAKTIIGIYTATVRTTNNPLLAEIEEGKTYIAVANDVGVPLFAIIDGVAYPASDVINSQYYEVVGAPDQLFKNNARYSVQIVFADGSGWINKSPIGIPDMYISPSTFTKEAGAKSIYISINSDYYEADKVNFVVAGHNTSQPYAGGQKTFKIDIAAVDVANIIRTSEDVVRVRAGIISSDTEINAVEADILKVDPQTISPVVLQEAVAGSDTAGVTTLTLPQNYANYRHLSLAVWEGGQDAVVYEDILIPTLVINPTLAIRDQTSTRQNINISWTASRRTLTIDSPDRFIYALLEN